MPQQSVAESAHESRWRVVAMLVLFLALLSAAAVREYRAATVPDPDTPFDGSVAAEVANGPRLQASSTDGATLQVRVETHADAEIGAIRATVREDLDTMSLWVDRGMSSLAGDEIVIHAYGDAAPAKLSDIEVSDQDIPFDIQITEPDPKYAAQPVARFTGRVPKDAGGIPKDVGPWANVNLIWRMRRPINEVGGRLVVLRYPSCRVDAPWARCDVSGGFIGVEEAVSWVSPPLTSSPYPQWHNPGPGVSPYLASVFHE